MPASQTSSSQMETTATNLIENAHESGIAGARQGTGEDAVQGRVPALVVAPASVEEVSRLLRWANERELKVTPTGRGTKQDRGGPPSGCDVLLDMSHISGVVEHAAGDMTVVVRAGTPFSDLQSELAGEGQFLAIDPPVPGTIGGLIATGDSGPRRLRYGGVRDMLLGVTFVRADGTVARAGSKVVKNVAGYDLPKLFTGSLGTLGVIVEATFRLYPIPPASATVIVKDVEVGEAARSAARLLTSGMVPTIVDYYAEARTGLLAARFETSPGAVQGQAARALGLLSAAEELAGEPERALWAIFDHITEKGEQDVLARLITTQTDLPRLLGRAQLRAEERGLKLSIRAHMGHGHALLHFHEPDPSATIELLRSTRSDAEARQSSLVIWRAPLEIRNAIEVWGDPGEGLGLMRRIKSQFDPKGTLNPGRFVGGI
jgi:glycolate oxidase FAD binding subunit